MPLDAEAVDRLIATIEVWQNMLDFATHPKESPEVKAAYHAVARRFLERAGPYPEGQFEGRGVVVCGGGAKYLPSLWVTVRMLRHLGCRLPIQAWYLGPEEMDGRTAGALHSLGVAVVDGHEVVRERPHRHIWGWTLKCFAILNSPFREVLLLDADNLPLRDPTSAFDWPEFREAGAVFWPDYMRMASNHPAWEVFDTPGRADRELETGQILVDKRAGWIPLNLVQHYDCHWDYYYQWVYGDKETFHHAYRHLDAPYAIPDRDPEWIDGCTCQHDLAGERIWQHRNHDKWLLDGSNRSIAGFRLEDTCRQFLAELRTIRGEAGPDLAPTPRCSALTTDIARRTIVHVAPDGTTRSIVLEPDGSARIATDPGDRSWAVRDLDGDLYLSILGADAATALLRRDGDAWSGPWLEWPDARA